MPSLRVIGAGRAGGSLARALESSGWVVGGLLGRHDDPAKAGHGVDLAVIATPDQDIAETAARMEPDPTTVVVHLAGSLGLDVLEPHPRTAALHPLASLPSVEVGAARLRAGMWFAVAGDPIAARIVADLGGRSFTVPDEQRAAYHAAACIASNHVVAVLGQVERVAAAAGVPRAPFVDLAAVSVANVAEMGPAAALTGPAARGDEATIARHLRALDPSEHDGYRAGAALARRLAGRPEPGGP